MVIKFNCSIQNNVAYDIKSSIKSKYITLKNRKDITHSFESLFNHSENTTTKNKTIANKIILKAPLIDFSYK